MNKSVKSVLVLSLICLICAVLLAGANMLTAPIIEENERIAAEAALREVLPGGEGFELVDKELYNEAYPDINEVKRASNGGYVFKITKTGYKSGLVIMCGVSAEGKITGAKPLSSNETKHVEDTYGENFLGKDSSNAAKVDTIANSTETTAAYKSAILDALAAFKLIEEGRG